MNSSRLILAVLAAATLGACVTVDQPRPVLVHSHVGGPYYVDDGIDMNTPVYFAEYPGSTFYHRYDPYCDCIRVVRMMNSGGAVFWLDQSGRRVHEGHWEPARPSDHALHGYRQWSHQHRGEFHRTPPPPPQPRPPVQKHRPSPPPPPPPPIGKAVPPVPPAQPEVVPKAAKVIQRGQAAQTAQPAQAARRAQGGQAEQRPSKAQQDRHRSNRSEQVPAKPQQASPQVTPVDPQRAKAESDSNSTHKEHHKKCPDGQKDC